jgi:hypothetical protein
VYIVTTKDGKKTGTGKIVLICFKKCLFSGWWYFHPPASFTLFSPHSSLCMLHTLSAEFLSHEDSQRVRSALLQRQPGLLLAP